MVVSNLCEDGGVLALRENNTVTLDIGSRRRDSDSVAINPLENINNYLS